MKLIETIMLRSTKEIPGTLIKDLIRNLHLEGKADYPLEVKIYRNFPLKMDLNIQLLWESDVEPAGESSLGRRIHHIIKDYGLVCHSVWIEEVFDLEYGKIN